MNEKTLKAIVALANLNVHTHSSVREVLSTLCSAVEELDKQNQELNRKVENLKDQVRFPTWTGLVD